MKKSIFFLALIISFLKLSSQNYYTITFQGNNASPETVRIDNLSQGTNLTINGDDVLRLVFNSTNIENNSQSNSNSKIYPNPMHDVSTLKFDNPATGNVTITIFNITGKKITSFSSTIDKGVHSFILSDFQAGSYIYNINTQSNTISGTFNSINNNLSSPSIKLNSETDNISNKFNSSINKSNKTIVEMNFNIGDALKITGSATGFEDVIIYNSPTSDKVFTFNFAATGFVCGNPITFIYNGQTVTYGTVLSVNNRCWLDRNLGASNIATTSFDVNASGDLFQWGRLVDGHQLRTSNTSNNLSNSDNPNNSNFILTNDIQPNDWRSPQNDNLWQGIDGVNNPCPTGWRLPSVDEFTTEYTSWSTGDAQGAFLSNLALPVTGRRVRTSGNISSPETLGYYWTSSIDGIGSKAINFSNDISISNGFRATGSAVRCIKD